MASKKTSKIEQILKDGAEKGKFPGTTTRARTWFRNQAKKTIIHTNELITDKSRFARKIKIGHMYMFAYEAKHKDTLPFYDAFPLVFPFLGLSDGFIGINMHYLPPLGRAKLMNALYILSSKTTLTESTKLTLSYDILKSSARFKLFKPTVHRYLYSQVRSRFLHIASNEWDIALMLPLERFIAREGGSMKKEDVWGRQDPEDTAKSTRGDVRFTKKSK